MEIRPECVPCLMRRVLFQARLANNGTEFDAVSAALQAYSGNLRKGRNSAQVATEVHRAAYRAMGDADPYREVKRRADDVASEYMDEVRDLMDSSKDRFRTAVLVSCIGNIMDFGSGIAIDTPEAFRDEFHRMVRQGIGADDTDILRELVDGSENVTYLFDNCGESQFDKVLLDEMRGRGIKVTGVVRGEPILNDVTAEDAERTGLGGHLDRMITTGRFAIGVDPYATEELRRAFTEADLVISKGMANYESLSDLSLDVPIAFILRSKCVPVAESLGVDTDINVVRVIP